ncbi:fungal hydrophobin [Panus rudis PR-1116 ss-1]|nr:fungal hydrophobin [Panus rudis PR-1116 ss-1]
MFSRAAAFTTLSLAVLAVATIFPEGNGHGSPSSCNTGPVQCCQTMQNANSPAAAKLLHSVGVPVESVTGLVGGSCTPVTVIGVAGGNCKENAVCCTNNNYGGAVALGCVPVSL